MISQLNLVTLIKKKEKEMNLQYVASFKGLSCPILAMHDHLHGACVTGLAKARLELVTF